MGRRKKKKMMVVEKVVVEGSDMVWHEWSQRVVDIRYFDMRLSGHDTKELAMDSFASTQSTFDDLVDRVDESFAARSSLDLLSTASVHSDMTPHAFLSSSVSSYADVPCAPKLKATAAAYILFLRAVLVIYISSTAPRLWLTHSSLPFCLTCFPCLY